MGLLHDFKHTIRNTYVADGVDLINREQLLVKVKNNAVNVLNIFDEDNSINYRNHWGTIILHALGFPTRQLKAKIEGPTLQNIYRNWFGYNKKSSTPAKVARAILMGLIVNPILLLPRALVGVAKVVTEVIPGTISRFFLNLGENIVSFGKRSVRRALADETAYDADDQMGGGLKFITGGYGVLSVGFGGIVWGVGAAFKSVYLTLCTLTSPIETVRASYHYGKQPIALPFTYDSRARDARDMYTYIHPGKPFGFFLAGLAVLGSFITFGLTGPFALKALTAALAPIAGGKIANAVASVEKIGNVKFIGPILTKIGEGFQKVASLPYISNALHFMRIGPTIQAAPAALIGLGAVIGGLIATVGTLVDKFTYKPWLRFWHSTSIKSHTGLSAASVDAEPLLVAGATDPNATLESPPTVRTPNRSLGEGSGTGPLFATRSTAVGSVPPPVVPTAEHIASLRV